MAKPDKVKDKKKTDGLDEKKGTSAKEVAGAMAANMAANQENKNWEMEREQLHSRAAKKALAKHEKELAKVGIKIPGKKPNPKPED
ncbi:MAG: hypothetical protein RBG13Loki_3681 [Promethearchaeota archaeon CR_4]|nr:MAG: hypothetical protein RBG13Loki_3681 [Candidatus Lokiarchaeota archaeon CR_4]